MSRRTLAALAAVVSPLFALPAAAESDLLQSTSAWESPGETAVIIREPTRYPATGEPFRVFGFTEREALEASADPYGNVWSSKHTQGDMANRWSHAAIVKVASTALGDVGLGRLASALLGATILLPKELIIDRRPSASDLVIADLPLYHSFKPRGDETRASLSLFGDGAFFFTYEKKF
jgi:hypothetical protein